MSFFFGEDGTLLRTGGDGTGGQVIEVPTQALLEGHVAVGDDLLFYGEDGTLLRTRGDGTGGQVIETPTEDSLFHHIQSGNVILFYGAGILFHGAGIVDKEIVSRTLLRTSGDGTDGEIIEAPTDATFQGHVVARENVLFYGEGGTLLRTGGDGTGGQVIELPTGASLVGHTVVGDDVLIYGTGGTLLRFGDSLARSVAERIEALDRDVLENAGGDAASAARDLEAVRVILAELLAHRASLEDVDKRKVETVTAVASALGGQAIPIAQRRAEAAHGLARFFAFPFSLVWDRERRDFAEFLADCRGGHLVASTSAEDADVQTAPPPHSESLTKACLEGWNARQAALAQTWWQSIAAQLPPGILLLFLLATLGGLYRYNLRLAGFHHSRADALEVLAEAGAYDAETLTQVADALAADKVEFGKGNTPSDQAVEIARSIVARQ